MRVDFTKGNILLSMVVSYSNKLQREEIFLIKNIKLMHDNQYQ